jgi:hypothetical protein
MHFQLRRGVAHGRQGRDGGNFARAQIETGARVNIAKRELEQVVGKIGRDIGQRIDHLLAGSAIDFSQFLLAS